MADVTGVVMDQDLLIREYRDEDFDALTILWRVAREQLLPEGVTDTGHNFYEDQAYFRNGILRKNHVWVVEIDHRPVAFMAMDNEFIDQLYVHPSYQRGGIGKGLLAFARSKSPEHLWLYTLQSNVNAQAFYEKNGFVAEKYGISPENEPDVEYHWRNAQSSI
jgi:ribosomal protein S18 acetylase RimI-like enzyme